jgi:hypothetical protein
MHVLEQENVILPMDSIFLEQPLLISHLLQQH